MFFTGILIVITAYVLRKNLRKRMMRRSTPPMKRKQRKMKVRKERTRMMRASVVERRYEDKYFISILNTLPLYIVAEGG